MRVAFSQSDSSTRSHPFVHKTLAQVGEAGMSCRAVFLVSHQAACRTRVHPHTQRTLCSPVLGVEQFLGPPVAFYPFLGEGSPTKIEYRKNRGHPYSNLSNLEVKFPFQAHGGLLGGAWSLRRAKVSTSGPAFQFLGTCSAGPTPAHLDQRERQTCRRIAPLPLLHFAWMLGL